MRIITKRTLRDFWAGASRYADARTPLEAWHDEVRRARWRSPADVKARYRNASVLKGRRVVFNIGGNKYRLIARVLYQHQAVYIRFVGTHAEYDRINANTV
jgi:mRNA interferase HigB